MKKVLMISQNDYEIIKARLQNAICYLEEPKSLLEARVLELIDEALKYLERDDDE